MRTTNAFYAGVLKDWGLSCTGMATQHGRFVFHLQSREAIQDVLARNEVS
jgi:hypothetical protein